MCFTKLLTILDKNSKFHTASFWIAIATLQLAESALYPAGLALLEQSLLTLESQGVFDKKCVEDVLLNFRKDPRMEWPCKQLDHIIGVNFANNFHFALVAYLLKGKILIMMVMIGNDVDSCGNGCDQGVMVVLIIKIMAFVVVIVIGIIEMVVRIDFVRNKRPSFLILIFII